MPRSYTNLTGVSSSMAIPRGLTDITIHHQTPEQRTALNDAMSNHRFGEVDALKSAIILHFGDRKVRFSTSAKCLREAAHIVRDIQGDIDSGRVKVQTPKFDIERPTAWMKLDSLGDD